MQLKNSLTNFIGNLTNLVTNKSFRTDGWSNVATNLNTSRSRIAQTRQVQNTQLDWYTLDCIYSSDGLGRRIVNILVEDAMRSFIKCDGELLKELQRVKAKQRITEAACFARLFGGAILVAFVDDGLDLESPLNTKNVKKVVNLRVFDRYQVHWLETDISTDYYSEYYGEPEIFTVTPNNQTMFRVHRSRCHIFNGDRASNRTKVENKGWDNSVLQSVYDSLRNYGASMAASAEIIQDFIQVVLSVDGLTDMIAGNRENQINDRMGVMDLTKSVANTIFLDAQNEKYEKKASSVAGLSELLDRFIENISAATGIPVTRLSGRAAGGLNSTGESDIGNWHDVVDAFRSDELEPAFNWLIGILQRQSLWTSKPSNFEWAFPSLKTPNELEWANIKNITAKTDEIYINAGAADAYDLFQKRFANGKFNTEISIDGVGEGEIKDLEVDQDNSDLLTPNFTSNKDSAEDELIKKISELL